MIKNISNLGDAALYCDFGDEVSKEINSNVIKYFNSIQGWRIEKISVDDENRSIPPITPTDGFGDNEDVGKEEPDDLPF